MSNILKVEQETIINYNEFEKTAEVYTHNRKLKNKLALQLKSRSDIKLINFDDNAGYVVYEVPKQWIIIKPPRVLSEKQLKQIKSIGI